MDPEISIEEVVDAFHHMQVEHARVVQHVAVRHGLNPTDMRVLKFLGVAEATAPAQEEPLEGGPQGGAVRATPTPTAVGGYLEMSLGAVTALLDRLERRELLQRSRNPADRRGILLTLTPAGESIVEQLRQAYALAIEDSLPSQHRATFLQWCRELAENLDRSITP